MLRNFGRDIFVWCTLLGFVCFFAGLYFGFRARWSHKPGASLQSWYGLEGYTPAGQEAVRSCLACQLGFFVCWLLAMFFGWVAGVNSK